MIVRYLLLTTKCSLLTAHHVRGARCLCGTCRPSLGLSLSLSLDLPLPLTLTPTLTQVHMWDLQTKQLLQTLEGHSDVVLGISCHPKRDMVASGGL